MRVLSGVVLLAAAALNVEAQRPDSQTICDYYAQAKYESNSTANQFKLIQHIVALAFGGKGSLSDAPDTATGILNPGVFDNAPVNLRSWFDGTRASTNLNNQAVGINWLDGGAEAPLHAFLNKSTENINISNTTNEYRLFTDFYTAFGIIFGCSSARQFPKAPGASSGPINLAYVHKFMQLNSTHLGHFINQVTDAAQYFGFSTTDANTLETFMNARYNVRCAPAVNGALYSLCQANECPLAAPQADCAAYANLGPSINGTGGGGNGAGGAAVPTTTGGTVPTSAAPTPTPTPQQQSESNTLAGGAIAGIAIGAAAVLLLAVGLFLWHRKRKTHVVAVPYNGSQGPTSPSYTFHTPAGNSHAGHQSVSTYNAHQSYMSHPPSEAGTYGQFQPKPEDALAAGAYHQPQSPHSTVQPMREIAEMEGQSPPAQMGAWENQHPVHQSLGGVATQDYGTDQTGPAVTGAQGPTSPGMVSDYTAQGPTSPYQSPHQGGMPPERRDHGPGGSVWQ